MDEFGAALDFARWAPSPRLVVLSLLGVVCCVRLHVRVVMSLASVAEPGSLGCRSCMLRVVTARRVIFFWVGESSELNFTGCCVQIYLMGLVNKPETSQGLKLWQGLGPSWEKVLR